MTVVEANDESKEPGNSQGTAPGCSDGIKPESNTVTRVERRGGNHGLQQASDGISRPVVSGSVDVTDPTARRFHQTLNVEYWESPLPPAHLLCAYAEVDSTYPREVIDLLKSNQAAQIEAQLAPIRAEAWALKVATLGVSLLPLGALGAAV